MQNNITMSEENLKRFISVVAGIGWSLPSTLELSINPWWVFAIALLKAFVIGAFAWLGQTAAKEMIVRAKEKFKNLKNKKS